jgi:hypothetical protein
MFKFDKASFYQNDFLFNYSIIISGFMPILGFVQMYSGPHVVIIDFQLLGLTEGGDSGD